jgi:WS/DGAT/MGAT family acyltransferase
MQRLSGLDASFLYLETPTQPLHVCSIIELDTSTMPGGYTFDRLRDELELRVKAIPEFREKLADSQLNLDHPVWVEDTDFNINRHLHRIGLPAPGGRQELAEICGHIASSPLDRSRPLWQMWVIEGIEDTAGSNRHTSDRLAVMVKVHHSGVDGVTATNLMSQLCSAEPDTPPPEPVDGPGGANPLQLALTGLVGFATRPLRLARMMSTTVGSVVQTLRRAGGGLTMARPFAAPATAFNTTITDQRNLAFAQLDLDDIKAIKNQFDVTVNDVVMALCAGALRRFLAERGELPEEPLVATVPVSVQERSDRPGHNQISGLFSRLETHIADPAARLRAIARASKRAKEHSSAIGATLLQDFAQFAVKAVSGALIRLYAQTRLTDNAIQNLVLSNVAGPRLPLYFLGSKIGALYPLGPIFHGCGLNITVMSLDDKLNVGIISCPELLADLWPLADNFSIALDELLAAKPRR